MNHDQFLSLDHVKHKSDLLRGRDLLNQRPRTLLFGKFFRRNVFHVYLDEQARIQCVSYVTEGLDDLCLVHKDEDGVIDNQSYRPSPVELYPERCDFEFCALLRQKGCTLRFAPFMLRTEQWLPFEGKRFEELAPASQSACG